MKILAVLIMVTIALASVSVQSNHVRAGITDYTAQWTSTNVYDTQNFTMAFTGLDTSASYQWTISASDLNGNAVGLDFGKYTHVPGTAVDAFSIGPATVTPYVGDWLFEYTGPFFVRDNYGQIIVRGFLAPDPKTYPVESGTGSGDWALGTGTNTYFNKVHVGTASHVGSCRNSVYDDYFGNWHYQKNACRSGVADGEIALMHYATDCATAWPSTDSIRFYDFDGTERFRVEIQEIFDYQFNSSGASTCLSIDGTFEGFIVLNTTGDDLPFIDNTYADAVYGSFATNPNHWDFTPGAYYYNKRTSGDVHISDGEAPFFVTESNAKAGIEYSIEISGNEIGQGGNIGLIYRQNTPAIHTVYSGGRACGDLAGTWLDTDIYSYAGSRSESRPVSATPTTGEFIACAVTPISIGTTSMTASEAQIGWFSEDYNVTDVITIEQSITTLIEKSKLNTDTGLNFLFGLILALSLLLVSAVQSLRNNVFAYLIAWTLVGGVWAVSGPATLVGQTAFVLASAVLWIFAFASNRGGVDSHV